MKGHPMKKRVVKFLPVFFASLLLGATAFAAGESQGLIGLQKGGNLKVIEASFKERLDANPADGGAAFGLAYTLKIMGNKEQSVVTALKGLKNAPGSPYAFLLEDFIDSGGSFNRETTRLVEESLPLIAASPETPPLLRFQVNWSLLNLAVRRGDPIKRLSAFEKTGFIRGAYFSEPDPTLSRLGFLRHVPDIKKLKGFTWRYFPVDGSFAGPPRYMPWPRGESNYYMLVPFRVEGNRDVLIYLNGVVNFKAVLDGSLLVEKNNFVRQQNPTSLRKVRLKAGNHRLLVEVHALERGDGLHLAILDSRGAPLPISWSFAGNPQWKRVSGFKDEGDALLFPFKDMGLAGSMAPGIRGMWLTWLGDAAQGRVLLDAAEEMDPQGILWNCVTAENYLWRADDLPSKIAESRAERSIERLKKVIPNAPMVRYFDAVLKQSNSDSDDDIRILRKLTADCPSNPAWFEALAESEMRKGWNFQARRVLEEASSYHPQCEDVEAEWVRFYSSMKDRAKEREAINRLAKLRDAHRELENYYEETHEWENLRTLYEEQIKKTGDRDKSYAFKEAKLDLRTGRLADAVSGFSALYDLDPKSPSLATYLATALFLSGKDAQARSVFEKLKERVPAAFNVDLANILLGGKLPFEGRHLTLEQVMKEDRSSGPEMAPSSLILDQMATRINPDGSSIERYHGIIKVNNKDGVNKEGELYIPGQVVLSARTIKPDGRILEPEISREKHTASLKGLEPGDLIEYEYLTLRSSPKVKKNCYITSSVFVFQDIDRPFHRTELYVEYPKGYPMKFREANLPSPGKQGSAGEFEWRDWSFRDMPRLPMEPSTPNKLLFTPYVEAVGGVTWKDLALYLKDGLTGSFMVTPELEKAYSEAVKGADTDGEKVKAVVKFCMDKVQGEGSSRWNDPTTTLLTGRGSRIPLAAALLKEAGVHFDILLAQPVDERLEGVGLPRFAKYRQPVLRVGKETAGKFSYFTLESPYQTPGVLPWNLIGSEALPLTADAPWEPVKIVYDGRPWTETWEKETRKLLANGDAEISYVAQIDPYNSASLRSGIRKLSPDQREKAFQQILSRKYGNIEMEENIFDNEDKLDEPLIWHYKLLVHGYLAAGMNGGLTVSDPLPALNLGKAMGRLDERTLPLTTGLPIFLNQEITLVLPEGFVTTYNPAGLKTSTPFGSYSLLVEKTGSRVVLKRKLDLPYEIVYPDRYKDFTAFLNRVDGAEDAQLVLEKLKQ